MAHHQFQGGRAGHCQLFLSDFRPLIDPEVNETDGGALTGRLSCGHSETGQTNRRNTNLDGHALNGRSKTALHFTVVRLYHSRPVSFRCRFQNARSVLRNLRISASIGSVQSNGNSNGFLKWESRSFWLDTIPLWNNECRCDEFPARVRAIFGEMANAIAARPPRSVLAASAQHTCSYRQAFHTALMNIRVAVSRWPSIIQPIGRAGVRALFLSAIIPRLCSVHVR